LSIWSLPESSIWRIGKDVVGKSFVDALTVQVGECDRSITAFDERYICPHDTILDVEVEPSAEEVSSAPKIHGVRSTGHSSLETTWDGDPDDGVCVDLCAFPG